VQIPLASLPTQLPAVEAASAAADNLDGLCVLVVDDELDSREFTAFALTEAGASVTSVASAAEALRAIAQSIPDVVVSDIGMPDMDGYSLMQQIRAQLPAAQVLAVALTAYAGEFDRAAALAAGFQQHISKPVEPQRLVSTISTLYNKAANLEAGNLEAD
jgi:CheY-like chemotaxis protein